MEDQLLNQGLTLMMAGMGTVFVFLTALVVAMTLMSRVIMRFSPGLEPAGASDEEVAAIAVAIARHRKN